MNYLHQINAWSIKHHPKWFVVLRALLGLSLMLKGIQFIKNANELELVITRSAVPESLLWLNTFIPWLHLFGGSLIIAGLFTRLSILFQIPILVGAVFFVNAVPGVLVNESDLFFSVFVLLLLFFFLIEGSGPFSLDNGFRSPTKNKFISF